MKNFKRREIECNIHIGDDSIVRIQTGREKITISIGGELSEDEFALSNAIRECISTHYSGKKLDRYFNPFQNEEDRNKLIKCEWLRSGVLRIHGETDKRWKHVNTIQEAIDAHRVFTCRQSLVDSLPKRRPIRNN